MSGEDRDRDWQAEAEELRLVVGRLRARLLTLARVLPLESLELLERGSDEPGREARTWDIFDGWEDTVVLSRSEVQEELKLLWARLAPPVEP